jgi:hypothetical protein
MSATSHICLEASDRETSTMVLMEPLDNPGILVQERRPFLPKKQALPRFQVHRMFLTVCLILI